MPLLHQTAAVSSTAGVHPCRAVNVPTRLLDCLAVQREAHGGFQALLVHLSSDQVYDGSRPGWREDDGCAPVNAYGATKREAEVAIQVPAWLSNPRPSPPGA